jgi:uncharacterized protein
MSERDGYQRGVPCFVTAVEPDPDAAARFYADVFGWETEDLMGPEHAASYYMCRLRGRKVAGIVSYDGAPDPPQATWTTHVWVDDADAVAARTIELGGDVIGQPFDSPAGGRVAILSDSDGAVFCAWQPREHRGAQLVNEPGAWSMSALQTAHPERASEFYTALFGWTTEMFAMGEQTMTLFRLPGYLGGEPHQPVSREVVAAMLQVPGGPSRWGVDFWVADADQAAARAAESGGSVVVAAHDGPGFRSAVLADPAGAVFTISQLVI